jgi:hypothetical protein
MGSFLIRSRYRRCSTLGEWNDAEQCGTNRNNAEHFEPGGDNSPRHRYACRPSLRCAERGLLNLKIRFYLVIYVTFLLRRPKILN